MAGLGRLGKHTILLQPKIPAKSIIRYHLVDTAKLDAIGRHESGEERQDNILNSQEATSIAKRHEAIESEIKAIKSKFGEKQRLFVVYREQLAQWEHANAELTGAKEKIQSIAWFEAEIQGVFSARLCKQNFWLRPVIEARS